MTTTINGYQVPQLNKVRVKAALRVVQRAIAANRTVDMRSWQSKARMYKYVKTEKTANECGTVCCFAGMLAISPEFKRAGGSVEINGCPELQGREGAHAISTFFDAQDEKAKEYVYAMCGLNYQFLAGGLIGDLYGKDIRDVNIHDIEANLIQLLAEQK